MHPVSEGPVDENGVTDQPRAYGLWESAVTPRLLAQGRQLKGVCWDSDGQTLVWLEERSGRGVLVAQSATGEAPNDLTSEHNVRAEVGYGGGDFTVHRGQVFFVGCPTGQLFRQAIEGGTSRAVTPQFGKIAAPAVSPDGRYVVYVHSDGQQDCIALVDTEGACVHVFLLNQTGICILGMQRRFVLILVLQSSTAVSAIFGWTIQIQQLKTKSL